MAEKGQKTGDSFTGVAIREVDEALENYKHSLSGIGAAATAKVSLTQK